MSEALSHLYTLLVDQVVPKIEGIQANHLEQRLQTDFLNQNIEDFRVEMQLHFAELRAELATIRTLVEDAMVTLRESEAANAEEVLRSGKKTLIH